jgi:FMN-dependent NADH-azoreductase
MLKLLHLDASPRGDFSISRQLSAALLLPGKTSIPVAKLSNEI